MLYIQSCTHYTHYTEQFKLTFQCEIVSQTSKHVNLLWLSRHGFQQSYLVDQELNKLNWQDQETKITFVALKVCQRDFGHSELQTIISQVFGVADRVVAQSTVG